MNNLGVLASLHRYPVKSMMGEALNAAEVTGSGLCGDRSYALRDTETGKIVSAKNPRKWPNLFSYHATYTDSPKSGADMPPVRVTLPDGGAAVSTMADFSATLSAKLGRSVTLLAAPPQDPQLEEYWPDMEELSNRDVVTDEAMPQGTFFDCATLHVLTTGTLDRLRELSPRSRFEPRRFRPNIIADTGDQKGFVENDWIGKVIAIGPEVLIKINGPCPRCVMTTLSQADLPQDTGVLKTAANYNAAKVGVYASVIQTGTIRIGDTLSVV